MKKIFLPLTILIGGLSALAVGQQANNSSSREIVIDACYINRDDYFDRDISAQDAGLLMVMNVREGDSVRKGDLLAQLDTTEAQMRRDVAEFRKDKAKVEAENTIRTRFAKATAAANRQKYDAAIRANKRSPFTFPGDEVMERKLQMNQSDLQIENEKFNSLLASLEVRVQEAEVKAATKAIERHKIVAPFDGQIDMVYRKANEWAQAGEPILRLVRYDEMVASGLVSAKEYNPHELENRTVTIEVPLARGQMIKLTGVVEHVGSELDGFEATFKVRARVKNRRLGDKDEGRWVLLHGLKVKMTIHLE